jgi:hypothetical protein
VIELSAVCSLDHYEHYVRLGKRRIFSGYVAVARRRDGDVVDVVIMVLARHEDEYGFNG